LGHSFVVSCSFNISQLSMLTPTTSTPSGRVQMALYTDNAGTPGTLVANTGVASLIAGANNLLIVGGPKAISAGTYWMFAVTDTANVYSCSSAHFTTAKSMVFTLGQAVPTTFVVSSSFASSQLNYYMGSCQNVYGNQYDLGTTGSYSPSYLLGYAFNVTCPTTISTFAMLTAGTITTGSLVQMALYSDVAGTPAYLMIQTNAFAITSGLTQIPNNLGPVLLEPGTYWLMAVYNDGTPVRTSSTLYNTIKYIPLTWGTTIPGQLTGYNVLSYTGGQMNYWIHG